MLSSAQGTSTSVGKPRPIAIASTVSGVFWESLTNNSKEGSSYLFLLDHLWLLEGELSTQTGNFHLRYICISIFVYTQIYVYYWFLMILYDFFNILAGFFLIRKWLPLVFSINMCSALSPTRDIKGQLYFLVKEFRAKAGCSRPRGHCSR